MTVSTPSLTTPTDLFASDNVLSDKMNDFQSRYARFLRCSNDNTAPSVKDPECNGSDSFVNVQRSYQSLLSTIDQMETDLDSQLDTTVDENADDEILKTYAALRAQRMELDKALSSIYLENKAGPGSSVSQLKQSMFANTLWIILASCLIWYAVIEMKS